MNRRFVLAAIAALFAVPALAQNTPSGQPTLNQARSALALTKSDSTALPQTRGIYIGDATACAVALLFVGDTAAVTFSSAQPGTAYPFAITKLMSTNTTCADVVGLW